MQKRKYVQVKLIEDQIQLMRAKGMTNREIADHFGLNLKQVKNWVNRHNRMQKILQLVLYPGLKEGLERMVNHPIRTRKRRLKD